MLVHLGVQRGFKDSLGELLQHTVLADQVSRFLVMGDDVIEQGLREGGAFYCLRRRIVGCGAGV